MNDLIKEISIKEIEGVSVGHVQDDEAKTGVSVLYFKDGAAISVAADLLPVKLR